MDKISHKVLALKYRPQVFSELIGQDVMVQTVSNSIKLNKIPNAFLLTGIRGTGKTTTARIIAKAINCSYGINAMCNNECEHCKAISISNHLDVNEFDAASKTGIDDIRELIDSSRYVPTSAKYKIFIIDEVHMLSKQAFNGLLKTLEEPPNHLKFIFATTEVKKIPVTIISRCQRFDLKRVSIEELYQNLKKITKTEGGDISEQALRLIAKASEGSVRDSLSLLDRALIGYSIKKQTIEYEYIQQMLGIADKSQLIKLFETIIDGDEKFAIINLKKLINDGIEPITILNEFLEIIYLTNSIKSFGKMEFDLSISETQHESISIISKKIDISTLMIFWQFVLKALEELNIVSNQILSIEMFVSRLVHLKDIPNFEEILESNLIQEEKVINRKIDQNKTNLSIKQTDENLSSTKQIKNIFQTKPQMHKDDVKLGDHKLNKLEPIVSFKKLIDCVRKNKEMELKYDLEHYVSIVKFSEGYIDITFNEKLGKNFIRTLSEKLFTWTGKRWVISLTQDKGEKTLSEKKKDEILKNLEQNKQEEVYKKIKKIFPDAILTEVKEEN